MPRWQARTSGRPIASHKSTLSARLAGSFDRENPEKPAEMSLAWDGEAVCCDDDGLPVFQKLRQRRDDRHVYLCAFDLIELDGKDLRREPIEQRKGALAKLLRGAKLGLQLNEHIAEPGDVVFRHACRLGLEGIVQQQLGSHSVTGRSRYWLKFKNPNAPAC